ncbi:MAG: biotin/lipoyl-containing protein, partial [Candidatus Dormibacteria bacterium]
MPEFRLPDLGEGVTEGEVLEWRVEEGASVSEDQVLVVVGTDKATVEIPSPFTGRVEALLVGPGERVRVGEPLLRVGSTSPAAEPQGTVPPAPSAGDAQHSGEQLGAAPPAAPAAAWRPALPAVR